MMGAASRSPFAKPSKYRNVKTTVDGVTYDSKKEAKRAGELALLQRAGEISDLQRQVRYLLDVNGVPICHYRADFTYRERGAGFVVEDVKGVRTPEFILKSKLMLAVHGITIRET